MNFTEELSKYQAALESEFKVEAAKEETLESARKALTPHLVDAIRQISNLARNAESESVRLSAAKFIYSEVCRGDPEAQDPLKTFLKELESDASS